MGQKEIWESKNIEEVYKRYYEIMFQLCESGLFNGLAHPDSIKCFGHKPNIDLTEYYNKLAVLLNKHGMYAENSGGSVSYTHLISMNVFTVVKDNVTARQVAMQYGIKINRSGLACCPFHKDKTPSMKMDKRYYCFGCGDTGDAIDFVAKYFGLAPKSAAMNIASDFGLNYDSTNRAPPKKIAPRKTPEQILYEEQRPVSDTHLDVYKRQAERCTSGFGGGSLKPTDESQQGAGCLPHI